MKLCYCEFKFIEISETHVHQNLIYRFERSMDHLNFLEMFREPDAEAIVSNFWV